ncbi:MAG: type I secretion C-terminal target domain-containing protein, partial [Pseudolabrys sp.]
VSFSGSADNVDFASWNLNQGSATDLINTGNGNDTVVTSWSHGPATQDVGYNGGSGTDTITMVFTPAQLEAILSNSTSESALQTYLDGSIASGDTLNLGATPWNATVTAFENAHLALSAGQTGNVVYGAIDTGGTDANLPDLLAGATGNNSDNTLIGIPAVANTLKGGSTSDTNEASADGNDILVGRDGNDVLWGGGGSDLLLGGDGNDRLHGGNGIDILSGGKGADIFFYSAADANGDGVPTTNADFIVDYSYMDGDKIDLTGLLGSVAGLSVSNVNDYVRIIETPGDPTSLTVQVDLNGTSGGANWVDVTVLDGYRQTSADVVGVGINGTAYIIGDSGVTATASDPIVLDLGAPGISFASANNGVSFDINGDGIKDQVAWTSSNDGILAYDVNGSGTIENGTEIFTPNFAGGNYASGLAALASLDSNADGVINSADTNFGKLLVWQDNNHNGIADPGEVTSLADHGITAINLDATPTDGSIDGQQLQAQGSFSNADGTTGTFVEVALDTVLGTTPDPSTVTSSPDPDQSVATVTETSNPSASESNANASVIGTADDDIIVAAPGNTLIGGSGNDNFVFK